MTLLLPASSGGIARAASSWWGPGTGPQPAGAMSSSSVALDAVADAAAMVCQAALTGNITKVGFPISAKTSSNAAVKYFAGVTGVTAGDPTQTAFGGSSPANPTQASLSVVWTWLTLVTPAAVVAGDLIAIQMWNDAGGTAPTAANVTLRTRYASALQGFPYMTENTTGAWVKAQGIPTFAYQYDTGVVISPAPTDDGTFGPTAFSSASTPNERGVKFQVPFACKIRAARTWVKLSAATATGTVKLYDASDTLLQSFAIPASSLAIGNHCQIDARWPEQALAAFTDYRLTLLATNGDTWITPEWITDAAASADALPEGARWGLTSRAASTPPWTDLATTVPNWSLRLSEVTA